MRTVLFYVMIFVCIGCGSSHIGIDCCHTASYPEITNEMLRETITEYVDKYNNKEQDELRNIVSLTRTVNGDTTLYLIANSQVGSLLWEKPVNLMTKVGDIYVGYYDRQMNDIRMTVEGVVNFMIKDYPFLKDDYEKYTRLQKEFPDDYGYQTAAFSGWILEGEAYILKFVDKKLVEKIIFSQIDAAPTIIEKFE